MHNYKKINTIWKHFYVMLIVQLYNMEKKPEKRPVKKVEKKPEKKKRRSDRSPSSSSESESSSSSSEDERGRNRKKKVVKKKVVKKRRRSATPEKRKRSVSRDSDKKKKKIEAAKKLAKAKADAKKKSVAKGKPRDKKAGKSKDDSSDDDVIEVTPSKTDTENPNLVNAIQAIGSTSVASLPPAMKTIPPTRGRTTAEIRNEQLLMWKNPAQQAVQSMFQGLNRNSPMEKLDADPVAEAQGSPKEDVWDMAFSGSQVQEQQAEETLDLFNPHSEAPTKLTNDIWNILRNVTASVPSSSYSTYSTSHVNRGLSASTRMSTSDQDKSVRARGILKKMKDIPNEVQAGHVDVASSPEPDDNPRSSGGIPGLSLEETASEHRNESSLFPAASGKPSTPLADRGLRKTIQMPSNSNPLSGFSSYPQNDPVPQPRDTPITHVLHSTDTQVSMPRADSSAFDRRYHDDELSRSSLDSMRSSDPAYQGLERRVDLRPAPQSAPIIPTQHPIPGQPMSYPNPMSHPNTATPAQAADPRFDGRPSDPASIPQPNLDVARLVVDRALHDPVVRNQLNAGVLPPGTLEALAAVLPARSNTPTLPQQIPVAQLPTQQINPQNLGPIPQNIGMPQRIQQQLAPPVAPVAPVGVQMTPQLAQQLAPIILQGAQPPQQALRPNPEVISAPQRIVTAVPPNEGLRRPEPPPAQPPVATSVASRYPPVAETPEETAARLQINVNDPPPVRRPGESEESFYDRFDAYYALKRKQEIAERLRMQRERERELVLLRLVPKCAILFDQILFFNVQCLHVKIEVKRASVYKFCDSLMTRANAVCYDKSLAIFR